MRDPLMLATGKALALVVAALRREGGRDGAEVADLMGCLAVLAGETDPDQGDILALWALMLADAAGRPAEPPAPPYPG